MQLANFSFVTVIKLYGYMANKQSFQLSNNGNINLLFVGTLVSILWQDLVHLKVSDVRSCLDSEFET